MSEQGAKGEGQERQRGGAAAQAVSVGEALEQMQRAMAAMEAARADKTVSGALLGALTWDFEQAEKAYRALRDAAWQERADAGERVGLAGPQAVCWEHQAGEDPIRLSFSVLVF